MIIDGAGVAFNCAYSKAPIIRTGHWAVLAVHSMKAELAYVPVRIIGTVK